MESSKQTTTSSSEEIDLLHLLAKAILAIKNNLALVIAAFLVGTTLGLLFYQFSQKVFESKMLISSNILTESYSKALIENLDKLIDEKNFQALSEKLDLTPELASKVDAIEIKSALVNPADTPEDTKVYLSLVVRVRDNSIWQQIQNGIIGYLQRNEFVKIRVEQRKKYINQVIEKINLELVDLEQLKSRIAEGSLIQSNKQNLVLFDPTTVNTKILDLNKEKFTLQNSLETVNSIQVVEGFTMFNKPSSPKLSLSLAAGSFFGLFFVVLIIGFKAIRSLLKLSEEKLK